MTLDDLNDSWSINEDDQALLGRLIEAIKGLILFSTCGAHLLAIGEAWDAIEQILEDEPVEVNVGLSISISSNSDGIEGKLFVCFRVHEEGIDLSTLTTSYSPQTGSDKSIIEYAFFRRNQPIEGDGLLRWVDLFEETCQYDDAKISIERDHV